MGNDLIPPLQRNDRPKPASRPARHVTVDNATVIDRANRWVAVEDAARALNTSMERLYPMEHLALKHARLEFENVRVLPNANDSAIAWRKVESAQRRVEELARGKTEPEIRNAVAALEAAVAAYIEIGGPADRAPGDGGWS